MRTKSMCNPLPPKFLVRSALLAASALGLLACGAPSGAEGIVNQSRFAMLDANSMVRVDEARDRLLITLSEEDGNVLRTVSITIPHASSTRVGDRLEVGSLSSGLTTVEVSQGTLQVTYRSDGARILSSEENVFFTSLDGHVDLSSLEGLFTGSFYASLEEGGLISGHFAADPP